MHVLITGRGTSGSWKIRGSQLGSAIGAAVVPHAIDVASFDVVVLVKRPTYDILKRLHRAGVKIVWDVVDAWAQPIGNAWSKDRCMSWLEQQVKEIRPDGIVAATQAMERDCAHFDVPVLTLPHHARPGLLRNPIRPVKVIGYEGGEHYLGKWRSVIEGQCESRGWTFVVNPEELADVDIVLALRESFGYAPRNYKSNVKLANAMGSGTPFIGNREAGYVETACGAEQWADDANELSAAFDALTPTEARRDAAERLHDATPRLDSVATTYVQWLRSKF